ncbi:MULTISPECIES: DNA cytosine methyltransferase [Clostridium]|uniref:DNA cytosine methyltransferase n=1 Tax=Clostridium faecium TaxID=2762223 RepID=A0ABR8YR84_9CLOT|nr:MULTISPECIES: DNA cytosine methyltransferase [Clostridium]MBD8046768.1 DNA cytosine methyltransferase [Clostridium faecium]
MYVVSLNQNNKGEIQMIKVLSLFSGIGAFEKALENLGIEH